MPRVRGPARSRSYEDILREAEELVSLGYKEIVITGTQVGSWGRELGYSLVDLFRNILSLSPEVHIRVSSILPHYLNKDLLAMWAEEERMLPHFHLPLQSGSPKILREMKRPYSLESYIKLVTEINMLIPDAGIGTDIIVGFPGETNEDFQKTLMVVNDLPFTYIHVFEFSPREDTPAASMDGQVPTSIRKNRVQELLRVANDKKLKFMESCIGKPLKAMVERHVDSFYLATSVNYLKIKIQDENLPIGDYIIVEPTKVEYPFLLATPLKEHNAFYQEINEIYVS